MSWEVRTMRSATSYFNFTLLRKNFARFWPIWSLYGLFWLAVLPLNILSNRIHWDGGMARSLPLNYLDGGPSAAVTLSALFGLLCAMAVFSYLYASRSVGMLHALPLRREGLFLTNYLSGLLFLLLPNLAVFLLALAAEVFAGTVVFSSLFTWLVGVSRFGLFFYSFAVFCPMFPATCWPCPPSMWFSMAWPPGCAGSSAVWPRNFSSASPALPGWRSWASGSPRCCCSPRPVTSSMLP